MLQHHARLILFGLVALMFGVVQTACACSEASGAHQSSLAATSIDTATAHDHAEQMGHGQHGSAEDYEHQDDHDCGHCNNFVVVSPTADMSASLPTARSIKSVYPSLTAQTVTEPRPEKQSGFRPDILWRNLPPDTPTSLKVRLLI